MVSYNNAISEIVLFFNVNFPIASHAGVVFGALTGDDKIDVPRMKLVRQISKGMLLTFHRAFDVCAESHAAALETIISIGCDRLLTSGGPQSNATLNIDALKALQQLARGRIEIVVAAGVSEENAANLLKSTEVSALHAGSTVCKTISPSAAAPASTAGAAAVASTSTSANAATGKGKHSVRGESPGLESFVAVGAGGDSPTPKGAATLEELRTWQCVDEDRVSRLVAVIKAAVAQRLTIAPPTTGIAATTGAGPDSPVPDGDYVRI
jgi:hypothetical protein